MKHEHKVVSNTNKQEFEKELDKLLNEGFLNWGSMSVTTHGADNTVTYHQLVVKFIKPE